MFYYLMLVVVGAAVDVPEAPTQTLEVEVQGTTTRIMVVIRIRPQPGMCNTMVILTMWVEEVTLVGESALLVVVAMVEDASVVDLDLAASWCHMSDL